MLACQGGYESRLCQVGEKQTEAPAGDGVSDRHVLAVPGGEDGGHGHFKLLGAASFSWEVGVGIVAVQ